MTLTERAIDRGDLEGALEHTKGFGPAVEAWREKVGVLLSLEKGLQVLDSVVNPSIETQLKKHTDCWASVEMIRTTILFVQILVLIALSVWLAKEPKRHGCMAGLASRYIGRHPGHGCRCYCCRHNAVLSIVAVLTQTPGRLLTNRRANRERRGYRELADGMLALASGDAARAMKHARKADTFLGRSAAGHLIVAEAAVLQGKSDLAKERFKSLLEDQHTLLPARAAC